MEHLSTNSDVLRDRLKDRNIYLFLDYDGTLTPIAQRPDEAILSDETKRLLKKISQSSRCEIAVVSGRSLQDIKKLVALDDIVYVGNHGMEIEGPGFEFQYPLPEQSKSILKQISGELQRKLVGIEGAVVENKGYCISLHHRLVDPKLLPVVENIFKETVSIYQDKNHVRARYGKMLLEVRPPFDWHKGSAVLWLLDRRHSLRPDANIFSIYLGDDLTDEDAFAVLKDKGLTILVGPPKESHAQYYINNTDDVIQFLRYVLKIVEDNLCPN